MPLKKKSWHNFKWNMKKYLIDVQGDKDKIDDMVYRHIRADINSPYLRENFMDYIKR